jgi:hypothetical protein
MDKLLKNYVTHVPQIDSSYNFINNYCQLYCEDEDNTLQETPVEFVFQNPLSF